MKCIKSIFTLIKRGAPAHQQLTDGASDIDAGVPNNLNKVYQESLKA